MALNSLGKFKNSLKLDARGSGAGVKYGPVYGNGKWIAIRASGNVISSTDGVEWTAVTTTPANLFNQLPWSSATQSQLRFVNGQFMYLAQATGSYQGYARLSNGSLSGTVSTIEYPIYAIRYSDDGITWNSHQSKIVYKNSVPADIPPYGDMTLDNGEDSLWYDPGIYGDIRRAPHIKDITYSNGVYHIVGSQVIDYAYSNAVRYTSTDLITWHRAVSLTSPYAFGSNYYTRVIPTATGVTSIGYFVILGAYGIYPLVDTNATHDPVYGNNIAAQSFPNHSLVDIASNGATQMAVGGGFEAVENFVAGSTQGGTGVNGERRNIVYVYTGTWTRATTPDNTFNLTSVIYANNKWIVAGYKYVNNELISGLWTSANNGATWQAQTQPTNPGLANWDLGTPTYSFSKNGSQVLGYEWTTTTSTSWSFVNYRIPNQQPYLDYGVNSAYGTWKTMDFWVYVENLTYNFTQYPIASSRSGANSRWAVWLQTYEGGYNPYVIFSSSDTSLGGVGFVQSKTTFRTPGDGARLQGTVIPGQWNHIRIVRNTGVGAIYINGQFDVEGNTTFQAPTGNLPAAGPLQIARLGDGSESYYARDVNYWIDEFTLNSNALNSPSATTISVPTERWFSTDTTLLLLHFDYNYFDDASVPITADSPLAARFTVQAQATKLIRAQAPLQAQATVTTTAVRARTLQAQLSALATEIIVNARTRGLASDMAVQATLATVTKKLNGGSAQLSSQASVTANAIKSNGTAIPMDARATLAAQPLRIKTTSVAMQVSGVELAAVVKIAQGYCQAFDVNATLTNNPVKTARTTASLSSQASINAVAQKVKYGASAMTVQADMVADIGKTKEFDANLTANVSTSTSAKKTARITLALQANAQQVATAIRTRRTTANLQAFNSLLAVGKRTALTRAQLTASTTMLTTTGNVVRAVIHMNVGAFELVQGTVIRYDPYYQIRIKPESRYLKIHPETRVLVVKK